MSTKKAPKSAPTNATWMQHVTIENIPASDIITSHEYGANYRDKLSEDDIAASAASIQQNGLPEPPWAMSVFDAATKSRKVYHIAGDKRLAGMQRLSLPEYTYRVVDASSAGIRPTELALLIRTVSDQVRPLSFPERMRQIRQHAGLGMNAKNIATRLQIQSGYVAGLLKLDGKLDQGWEDKVNAQVAQKLYSSQTPKADYEHFVSSGKLPKKSDSNGSGGSGGGSGGGGRGGSSGGSNGGGGSGGGNGGNGGSNGGGSSGQPHVRGRAAAKEKALKAFQEYLAAKHGAWIEKLPWPFLTLPTTGDDGALFEAYLKDLRAAIISPSGAAIEEHK